MSLIKAKEFLNKKYKLNIEESSNLQFVLSLNAAANCMKLFIEEFILEGNKLWIK